MSIVHHIFQVLPPAALLGKYWIAFSSIAKVKYCGERGGKDMQLRSKLKIYCSIFIVSVLSDPSIKNLVSFSGFLSHC